MQKKESKEYIKNYGDFGMSHHSTTLTMDNNFLDFRNYIGQQILGVFRFTRF
jgi:hypothetical protein